MKRTFLSLLGVLLLAVAGSVVAQTDYGTTDQSGTTTPYTAPQSGSPTSTSGATTDTTAPSQAQDPSTEPPVTEPTSATDTSEYQSLPATASQMPLALVIGLSALGLIAALRAIRLRRAH